MAEINKENFLQHLESLGENTAGWIRIADIRKVVEENYITENIEIEIDVPNKDIDIPQHQHSPACNPFTDERNPNPGHCLANFPLEYNTPAIMNIDDIRKMMPLDTAGEFDIIGFMKKHNRIT